LVICLLIELTRTKSHFGGKRLTYLHVVLISFRADSNVNDRAAALVRHGSLGEQCGGRAAGILHWQVAENLDQRKGWHAVEFAIFADRMSFEAFRRHPAHVMAGTYLSEIADWAIGDLETDLAI
jgi:hypothetical protein